MGSAPTSRRGRDPRRPPRQRAAKRTGRKEEQTKSDRGPVHLPGAVMRRAAPSPAGAGTPRRPPRQRAAKRTGRKEEQTKSDHGPVHLPGALCGEQPLHPPGLGTLNGRPGSAQRSGTRGSRNTPIQVSTPSALRPIECGGAVLRGTGPAQGRRGHRSPPDQFARPPHTQTGGPDGPPVCQNGFLFHRARRILFCQDKREWGAHPRRDPAPPEAPAP